MAGTFMGTEKDLVTGADELDVLSSQKKSFLPFSRQIILERKGVCNVFLKERCRQSTLQINKNHLRLKGLGHAILGNFSSDRMVIELTKISK